MTSDGIRKLRNAAKVALLIVAPPLWLTGFFIVPEIYKQAPLNPAPDAGLVWSLSNHGALVYVSRVDFLIASVVPLATVVVVAVGLAFFLLLGAIDEYLAEKRKIVQR